INSVEPEILRGDDILNADEIRKYDG
ncbi:hypothetical protein LCGC14_2196370, partial [marine sediment metagenome]